MLQTISDKIKASGKWGAGFFIVAGIILFAGKGGLDNAPTSLGEANVAAMVDDHEISLSEFNRIWSSRQAELVQAGQELPEDLQIVLKEQLLEELIRSHLMRDHGADLGYRVSADRVAGAIRSESAFQLDGRYNESLALARLAQVGLSVDQYRAQVQGDLESQELQRAIGLSEFLTPNEVGRRLALEDEERELRYLAFDVNNFKPKVIEPAALESWYATNSSAFLTTEQVTLRYLRARAEDYAERVAVTESDLRQAYADQLESYVEPERRQASHILVDTEEEATSVIADLQAGGDFAALARQRSKDQFSAVQGGDLGFGGREAFEPAFANALFALSEGQISEPVQTEFGFHVIRLEAVDTGRTRPIEEVRSELESSVLRARQMDYLDDQMSNAERLIERGGNDLQALAAQIGVGALLETAFVRGVGSAELGISGSDWEDLIFSDLMLGQRRLSPVRTLADNSFVVMQVIEHAPSRVPDLTEVRAQAQERYALEVAIGLAATAANKAKSDLQSGRSWTDVARRTTIVAGEKRFVTRADASLPPEILTTAFNLSRPNAGQPVWGVTRLPDGNTAVVEVSASRMSPTVPEPALRAIRGQSQWQALARSGITAYLEAIRGEAEVIRNEELFEVN